MMRAQNTSTILYNTVASSPRRKLKNKRIHSVNVIGIFYNYKERNIFFFFLALSRFGFDYTLLPDDCSNIIGEMLLAPRPGFRGCKTLTIYHNNTNETIGFV